MPGTKEPAAYAPHIALKRKIVLIMAIAAIIPLIILAAINYFEFQAAFLREAQTPFRAMVNKTKSSFELFLAERASTVSLMTSLYSYEELADPRTLRRIFLSMEKEFTGFADLGLIDSRGRLVNYVGPHYKELEGVDYSDQDWFHKVRIHSRYISEVFSGFRHVPHVIVAVHHNAEDGRNWVIRATLDTGQFSRLIESMNLEPSGEAFLINRDGTLQTDSARYGKTFEKIPFSLPSLGQEPVVMESRERTSGNVLLSFAGIQGTNFVLVAVKEMGGFFQNWLLVRADLLFIFVVSALCIYFVAAHSVGLVIERLRRSDREREQAMLQMEHSHKLSSIGRLAAGIAHEVNNPLAIINEKAGLLQDIMGMEADFPRKETIEAQLSAIIAAVQRCKDITYRMLGFARRMDVKVEVLDVNAMVRETLTFLGNEALYRRVKIVQALDEGLPGVPCDRGQMQQVFLNVLTNALAAVSEDGEGQIVIRSFKQKDAVSVSFQDNGAGMDEATQKHIFEPFFTTKGKEGTGLGMSIIYGIIKRHHGDIRVESELGQGTTITISLPFRQPGAAS